ncbi:MAG: hypothetical protein OEN01_01690 [Candidatus Krumholzibacteria bacterium]|nr:hypothetical protein [Candidatus Krumholzibacteria bacterium]
MNRRRRLLFHGTTLSIVALIVLLLCELTGRYRFHSHVSLTRDVDHRPTPNTAEHNSDGIRCGKEARDFAPDDLNIIFLGDSYVYGHNTYPQFAFPLQFEVMARASYPQSSVNVANFGWVSASPYLSLRLLKDIGRKYNPDVIFLCIDMTDFHDDLKYEHLIERPRIAYKMLSLLPGTFFLGEAILGKLTRHGPFDKLYRAVFGFPKDRFFVVNEPLEQTQEYCANILSNINDVFAYATRDLEARCVLVILPRSFQYSARECPDNWEAYAYEVFGPHVYEPFALFDGLKQNVDYPIYSLLDAFRHTTIFPTCLYNDPHWNAAGCKIAAQSLIRIAEKEGVFAPPVSTPGR